MWQMSHCRGGQECKQLMHRPQHRCLYWFTLIYRSARPTVSYHFKPLCCLVRSVSKYWDWKKLSESCYSLAECGHLSMQTCPFPFSLVLHFEVTSDWGQTFTLILTVYGLIIFNAKCFKNDCFPQHRKCLCALPSSTVHTCYIKRCQQWTRVSRKQCNELRWKRSVHCTGHHWTANRRQANFDLMSCLVCVLCCVSGRLTFCLQAIIAAISIEAPDGHNFQRNCHTDTATLRWRSVRSGHDSFPFGSATLRH